MARIMRRAYPPADTVHEEPTLVVITIDPKCSSITCALEELLSSFRSTMSAVARPDAVDGYVDTPSLVFDPNIHAASHKIVYTLN